MLAVGQIQAFRRQADIFEAPFERPSQMDSDLRPSGATAPASHPVLQIAKIKIYNLDGMTVFSTDETQIGEDKSSNAGFLQARAGAVVSQINFREKFDAFEGVLNNRNLISSYLPARASADTPVESVFEVYSDVTDLLHSQTRAQWQVAAIVLPLLSTLYLFLLMVVRKADRIISLQEQERGVKAELVRHQAYHDALTGLPNRACFAERLSETIALAARTDQPCALMFVDLDRFKIVNDSLGHAAADTLLKVTSDRIQGCLRKNDLLFRMGGDEFTIILPQLSTPEDAAFIARRIQEAVATPVSMHGSELIVGATVGIALYPGDGDSAEALLKNADAAMYSAKEGGRGRHAFYRAAMNQRASQRLGLELALKQGFRDGEFTLHYQPRGDAGQRPAGQLGAFAATLHGAAMFGLGHTSSTLSPPSPPGASASAISMPWRAQISFTMARPRPLPCSFDPAMR